MSGPQTRLLTALLTSFVMTPIRNMVRNRRGVAERPFDRAMICRLLKTVRPCATRFMLVAGITACGSAADGTTPPPGNSAVKLQVIDSAAAISEPGQVLVLRVKALTANGAPSVGAVVTFRVGDGGGTVVPSSATTLSSGEASAVWTTGMTRAANTVVISMTTITPIVLTTTVAPASISFAQFYSCGFHPRSNALCWGMNAGNLGDGTKVDRWTPTKVEGNLPLQTVVAGNGHNCGLTIANDAYCWGNNVRGQLGDGTTTSRLTPTAVVGGLKFTAIAPGYLHTCGVTLSAAAYCWGLGAFSAIGDGTTEDRLVPTPVSGNVAFRDIATGNNTTCGIAISGDAYCWGFGAVAGPRTSSVPVLVPGGLKFQQIVIGNSVACGLATAGTAYCWGSTLVTGELGDGNATITRSIPAPVVGSIVFTQLTTKFTNTCGLANDRRLYCWGANPFGQFGDGTLGTSSASPILAAGGMQFTSVATGGGHTCGFATSGDLYCWGRNEFGEIGDGTTTSHLTPIRVSFP